MNREFSVCISVYKNDLPGTFTDALKSIINQTLKPSEIVLVVDGPVSHELSEIIDHFEADFNFIKVIRLKENLGLGCALAIGIQNCSYELIARMDSDDISLPDRFEKQIIFFQQNPEISVLGGQIQEFTSNIDNVIAIRNCPITDIEIKKYLKKRCPFNHMSVMFRRSHVINAGNYTDWKYDEDYYLWIRMYLKGYKFHNLADNLVFARVGNDMYSRRGGFTYFFSEARLQMYLFDKGIINLFLFVFNISIRFIIQVAIPNNLRGYIFKKLFRVKNV